MQKLILMAIACFCFGSSFSQDVRHYKDAIRPDMKEQLASEQHLAFDYFIENIKFSTETGQYEGIYFEINIDSRWKGKFMKTSKYVSALVLAIDKMQAAGADLGPLRQRPLQFYFINPKGRDIHYTAPSSDFSGLSICQVQTFTHDYNWIKSHIDPNQGRLNRIVSTVPPSSTNTIVARMLHGIGRILHEEKLGEAAYWSPLSNFNINYRTTEWGPGVSDRAAHSSKDFVAELFMFVVLGKLDEILPDYNQILYTRRRHTIQTYVDFQGPVLKFGN